MILKRLYVLIPSMKRSHINRVLRESVKFISSMGYKLPPFAFWSPAGWRKKGREADEIRDNMLGWDITDFGKGDFQKFGLVLFTARNGNYHKKKYRKNYCEKIMIAGEMQVTPMHYHLLKMEDIINRGGGNLVMKVYNSTKKGRLSGAEVILSIDGVKKRFPAGSEVVLSPGESVSVPPFLYHSFCGEEGKGSVLAGEISEVNDDRADNFFLEEAGRFPVIEEDEEPEFLLCSEYP